MSYRNGQVSVRDLRARLKQHLEAKEAAVIGDTYHVRAILVPVPPAWPSDAKGVRAVKRVAKQRFTDALRRAWPER